MHTCLLIVSFGALAGVCAPRRAVHGRTPIIVYAGAIMVLFLSWSASDAPREDPAVAMRRSSVDGMLLACCCRYSSASRSSGRSPVGIGFFRAARRRLVESVAHESLFTRHSFAFGATSILYGGMVGACLRERNIVTCADQSLSVLSGCCLRSGHRRVFSAEPDYRCCLLNSWTR